MNSGQTATLGPIDEPGESNINEGFSGLDVVGCDWTYCFLRIRLLHKFSLSFTMRWMNVFISESTAKQLRVSSRPSLRGWAEYTTKKELRALTGLWFRSPGEARKVTSVGGVQSGAIERTVCHT